MNKKRTLLLIIPLVLLLLMFTSYLKPQAETITIEGILAHDIFNYGHEPSNYAEVEYTLQNDPDGRTGYSGQLYVCLDREWIENGNPVRTDDSGRDKIYAVADYKSQIVSKYGEEVYEKALASGLSLVYDQNKGKKVIHSEKSPNLDVIPCDDGDTAYFYNNLDFWLTLTFTAEVKEEGLEVIPPTQTINVGETANYQAMYTNHDGKTFDVTEDATWTIDNNAYASSDGYGRYTGVSKGNTTVTAKYDGMTDHAELIVIGEGDVIPVPDPEPELEPNIPPVAIIDAPTVVELGETFCIRSNSYDPDGYIEVNDWYFGGELDDDDEEGFTETTTSKCGVYYEDIGEQEIWLQVTDDRGSSDDTTHTIEVVYPIPDADFEIKGFPIQNRAVWLEIDKPYGRNETAERKYKITESVITVKALDSKNQSAIYVINDDLNNVDYNEIVELLFRNVGDYEITYYIKNNRGQSDMEAKIVSITEDMIPTASIETSEVVYLNEQGKQTVSFEISSNSEDDIIGNNILEIAWDSNNDGKFENETFTTVSTSSLNRVNYDVSKLGNYKVRLTSFESFDEQTYPSVVDLTTNKATTHRKFAMAETTFEVDNMAPVVSLTAKEQPEVEIIFNTGDVVEKGTYTKAKLQTQINNNLLPQLAAEGVNANVNIQEKEYYEDVIGGYYRHAFNPRYSRNLDKSTIAPVYYYMNFDDGVLKRVNLPKEAVNGQIDYDGNIYFNIEPENTSDCDDCGSGYWWRNTSNNGNRSGWANSRVEIYKYDRKTDSSNKIIDKQFLIDELVKKEHYTGNRRLRGIALSDIFIANNEKLYLLLSLDIATGGYSDAARYIGEFETDGRMTNLSELPADDDDPLEIYAVTENFIVFEEDHDLLRYVPMESLWSGGSKRVAEEDIQKMTTHRIITTKKSDYYYGGDWDGKGYYRLSLDKSTNLTTATRLWRRNSSINLNGIGGVYVYDYDVYGATRNGELLSKIEYKLDDDDDDYHTIYPVLDDKNFALNDVPYNYKLMSNELKNLLPKPIYFGQDNTYRIVDGTKVSRFDETTHGFISELSVSMGTPETFGPYCRYDDDRNRCVYGQTNLYYNSNDWVNGGLEYLPLDSTQLPVRAYKKTLADTLEDTNWESETSTKFYVTLSNGEIDDLPNEKEEVASLLNQDDVRYISIDTTSTKTIAQQLAAAIDEATLQVTTTYTDNNMKTSMTKIKDFVVGEVFPPIDPTIDIHLGVDDSQYSLTNIRTAINNILKPNLINAGITDINISSEVLVNRSVNGQSVRKFNSNKENEYYVLFKDTALTTQNLNHLVGDLLLQDAYFVGIGKHAAKTQFDTAINKNMYRGTIINQPTSLNDSMEKLSEYLINTIREREGESVVYATTEANKVLYETSYWDFENNPKFKEVYKTIHDPSVFENDQGKTSFAQGNLPEIFTKVGLYKPSYQAQDNPLGSYNATQITQFAEYRKWSNEANNAKIYIHRLPIPEFNINFNKTTRAFSATNTAYDLDKRSINIGLGGGIAKQQFQWRKQGENVWKNGLPSSPLENVTYEIKNEVTDFQNETNYLIKEVNKIGPPVAEFTPNPSVIEEGDSVNFINTSYEPTGDDMVAKWYYKKSTTTGYTLFATGNYVNGVGNVNWNPTTNLLNRIGTYDIKLVVTDEDGMSDEVIEQVEVVEKSNTPPVACMQIPSPNYIGDTIVIINCASDVDGDTLSYTYTVKKPNGTTATYSTGHSNVAANGNLTIVANQHPVDIGTWTIEQTVSDGTEEAKANGNMVVLDQTIQGDVAHTEQWLKNLQKYNIDNPSKAFNLNSSSGLLEFIPGERFVLNTVESTTNRLTSVRAYIKTSSRGINYRSLYGNATLNRVDSKKFTGSLWHESMVEKFQDGEVLTFEFVGTFANGWVDTHTVQIKIKDDPYWKQHTTY